MLLKIYVENRSTFACLFGSLMLFNLYMVHPYMQTGIQICIWESPYA
jgi:hypothetical protein